MGTAEKKLEGCRRPPQRLDLRVAVEAAPRHFNADELLADLNKMRGRVPGTTVYNKLSILEECGPHSEVRPEDHGSTQGF